MHDNDIKKLIKILEESKIDELEISTFWGRQKIRLRKSIPVNDHDIHVNNNRLNQIDEEDNTRQTQEYKIQNDELIKSKPIVDFLEPRLASTTTPPLLPLPPCPTILI